MKAGFVGLVLCLAFPALAQEQAAENRNTLVMGKRGEVARLFFAQDLFAMGMAEHDAVVVLAAARLASGIGLRASDLTSDAAPKDGTAEAAGLVNAQMMLAEARAMAATDEAALSLVEAMEATPPEASVGGLSRSDGTLEAGASESWTLPFYSSVLAEIAVLGNGQTGLDVRVTDENGNLICARLGPDTRAYCDWVPAWNGYFKITVANPAAQTNSYVLLSN